MQDRVSTYPGRITLTPVTGESNTYDWARADDPSVVGTPLNKATFLPDDVASAIATLTGETINLPADALSALCTALDTVGLTRNAKISYGSWTGTGSGSSKSFTFSWTPYIVIATKTGNAFVGSNSSTSDAFLWINGQTSTGPRTFTLSGKQLTWKYTNSTYQHQENLNESGVAYSIIGVCLK